MSYPSVNSHSYYSSSKDAHYHSGNAPVNVAPPPSAYGAYPSSQSYGHSVPASYASSYGGSVHPVNGSAYSTYSAGGYAAHTAATPRTPHPSTQYYHHSGQAYPPPHLPPITSYDARVVPPPGPSSKAYPASPSRQYQCSQCALSFDRSHDLKRHTDSHSGAKPYACDSCSRTFTRKDALKRHQSQKQCGTDDA